MGTIRAHRQEGGPGAADSSNGKDNWRRAGSEASRRRQIERLGRVSFGLLTSSLVRKPLAGRAAGDILGALHIVDTKRCAVVVAKIEFADVALQVRRAHVLIGAVDTTLQN